VFRYWIPLEDKVVVIIDLDYKIEQLSNSVIFSANCC